MSAERVNNTVDLAAVRDPLLRLYLSRNWLVFPCGWYGRRNPLVDHGFYDASRDPGVVADWSRRWSRALWAVRTGKMPQGSGLAIVDLDRKNGKDGFATFARLTGSSELPPVPRVHTPSGGGLHLYFLAPPNGCFSTTDVGGRRRRGLGPGIDFKCDLAQCHLPGGSPSSPYRWDDEFNLVTIPTLTLLPAVLTPVEVEIPDEEDAAPPAFAGAGLPERRPASGKIVDLYAKAAISKTCDRVRAAVPGTQRKTLNDESFQMGSLAAGLSLDHRAVVEELIGAGLGMQQQAGREPWTRYDVRKTVLDGFRDGLRKPYRPQIGERR